MGLRLEPMMPTFSGGSLLIAWQLKSKHVLIVGGGDVASGRLESVLSADAFVTIISPHDGLHPITQRLINTSDRVVYHDRVFLGRQDLTGMDMVLTAIDDVEESQNICEMCRELRIPVNAADIPSLCDFYFGSQIRDGPLQIMISTNGQGPKLANLIRKRIETALPKHAGQAITRVGLLRERLKERALGVGGEVSKRRMKWMVDVCTSWQMEDLARLDDEMIGKLLEDGWEKHRVPGFEELGGVRQPVPVKWSPPASLLPVALAFAAGAVCATLLLSKRPHG